MTDPNSPSHWDVLASTLGAPPPQEEVLRQPSPPPVQQPPAQKPTSHTTHHRTPPKANWDALASDLGLAPEAPSMPPAKPTVEASSRGSRSASTPAPAVLPPVSQATASEAEPPALIKRDRRDAPTPETPEESPNFFDERFDFEEPFDLLESSEAQSAAVETPPETSEPSEKPPRRKRRRRRGRGGAGRKETPEGAAGALSEQGDSAHESHEEQPEAEAVETLPAGVESQAGESEKPRPKRRRSRRGKKRRDPEATPGTAEEPSAAETQPAHSKSRTPEAISSEDNADDDFGLGLDETEEGGEERPARLGFRGIPTWEEAVGMLIEKNIESRAKRPSAAFHHGRGNRGPRGGRGGKQRS